MSDLSIESVRARVAALSETDDERAHADEDALYRDVLAAIADGALKGKPAQAIAAEALKSRALTFSRRYA